MVETYNAYLLEKTIDIDKNGKKEIWVGGDAFYPGIGAMTRITLFEADGNDSYTVVGRIDLIGVFSFFAFYIQSVDVDMDGTEEMMLCLDQTVVILKFNGSQNHHTYEVFYVKKNISETTGYYGATMYDLNDDSKCEILINSFDDPPQQGVIRMFCSILRADYTVEVTEEPEKLPNEFQLFQNYPNPFNPYTTIRFDLPEYSEVSVRVYDILGKEITTLLKKEMSPGSYALSWEARGSNGQLLPSGVYLIRMSADKYTKTIKALFLK